MDQSSLVSKPALLPVVFSNEATTIVGIIMSVETQCATTSHFNLTFERLMEFGILMSDDSLDPEKHSSVTFKENFSPISGGKKIDKSLRGQGIQFNTTRRSRIPLSDSINSLVELISSQLEIKAGKGNPNKTEEQLEVTEVPRQ
ncbi:hypothetical protein Goklo_001379 [Gossypium klotzschianum]|uniref:Uncharacterized protein n=1 Tax=Gossypium klotzschianum TaxID=34286 RepID=A0A7J8W0T7_9ROSI|nr:hypothetical protein [Gossypium klotzschianum]